MQPPQSTSSLWSCVTGTNPQVEGRRNIQTPYKLLPSKPSAMPSLTNQAPGARKKILSLDQGSGGTFNPYARELNLALLRQIIYPH